MSIKEALTIMHPGRVEKRFYLLAVFVRFLLIFTIYKVYDMICFDYFLLMKFRLFQYYYSETENVCVNRKYGFNIKS